MAEISKIKTLNGTTYDIKDAVARSGSVLINQGIGNAGKVMAVNPTGNVVPTDVGDAIEFDGTYNVSTNKAATVSTVTTYVDEVASRPFFTTIGFSIAVSDWSGNESPYSYTLTNSAIGQNTTVDVYPDYAGCGDAFASLSWTRTQNGSGPDFYWGILSNGIQFFVKNKPNGTISGTIRVLGNSSEHRLVEFTDDTVPLSKGGTGATNAAGARVNLGLGAVENKSSATIRSEITQTNINDALGTGIGTSKYYREDGTWAVIPDATSSTGGLMSYEDKVKLDGIESGATALVLGVTSSTAYRGDYGNTSYSHATDSARLTTAKAAGLYKVAITQEGHVASVAAVEKSDITSLGIPASDTTYSDATTSASGLMSASDKTKLNGIAEGATANVGTITGITMNGVSKGTSGVVNLGTVLTAHQSITHLAPKASPVFTGSISLGRKSNSTVGTDSFAVGSNVTASEQYSHAEGSYTTASGANSHAEGNGSTASNNSSHAEGYRGSASGAYSHAEGDTTIASGKSSHAEGSYTIASGTMSHAEGCETTANHAYQHTFGAYNISDTSTAAHTAKGNYIEIVGNGISSALSNARTLDWSGNERLKGTLYVNANADGSGGTQVLSRGTTWGDLKGT